ncbi:MAG: histidine phosphatase family protein [Myxococcota bacterium]
MSARPGPLVIVRHAPPLRAGICYGRLEIPVAPDAREAAALVQLRLRPELYDNPGLGDFSTVYSSPSSRCRALAEKLALHFEAELVVDPRLRELNFGAWEGIPWSELHGDPAFEAWAKDWTRLSPPRGESLEDLEARVSAWWGVRGQRGGSDLLVGHAGVIRCLKVLKGRASWTEAMSEAIPHLVPITL